VRRARSSSEFIRAPAGRYLAGRNYLYACFDASLFAQVLWGRPDARDIEELVVAYAAEISHAARPHGSLFDASRLDGVDGDAYRVLVNYMEAHGHLHGRTVLRQAVVRPAGMPGMVVAGFHAVMPQSYPTRVFTDRTVALEWLGRAEAAQDDRALDALASALVPVDPLVRRVRELIRERLPEVGIAAVARAARVSERTLQRRLFEAGTTYRDEVRSAQIDRAQVLMQETDRKLGVIALEVGCASLQGFSTLFRRATGVAPSRWRSRRRAETRA
jgi:AraC-like DNA-binding protein